MPSAVLPESSSGVESSSLSPKILIKACRTLRSGWASGSSPNQAGGCCPCHSWGSTSFKDVYVFEVFKNEKGKKLSVFTCKVAPRSCPESSEASSYLAPFPAPVLLQSKEAKFPLMSINKVLHPQAIRWKHFSNQCIYEFHSPPTFCQRRCEFKPTAMCCSGLLFPAPTAFCPASAWLLCRNST